MVGPGETVKVINQEDYPVTIGWGNVEYMLQPGKEQYVPADAVMVFFGDWRATENMRSTEQANGQHGWIPDRPTEVRRLRIKWAALNYNNGEEELLTPQILVYSVDGEEIHTVANDPKGEHVIAHSSTQSDMYSRDAIIEKMQSQLDQLIKERNLQEMVEPVTVESEIPVDEPTNSRKDRKAVVPRAANDE